MNLSAYTPEACAVLCEYLGLPSPPHCVEARRWVTRAGGDDRELRNEVAKIALKAIQDRLPNCGISDGEGHLELTRKPFERPSSKLEILPRHLFTINWADSGPGVSWPETYYASYLPGFDLTLVTASQDSPDAYGYEDLALGYFGKEAPLKEGVHDVLVKWWASQRDGWDQARWSSVWNEGVISCTEAYAWANEVWGIEEEPVW